MSVPTLLVGLGGAGLKIVKMVYNRATEEQRENIAFVVFDTDVNELRAISESKMNIHAIQISAKMTVGEYLKYDDNARQKWFPVNNVLNSKVLTEGAGQVRAISRLAFNTALVQGRLAPLDEAIAELYKLRGDTLSQAPRVIITGSLCGGTGSGLSLPVSMYIRNYLQTKVQQGSAIMRGFFLLPEVFFSVITGNSERNNLRCNAYAAIREIDAFMMKADNHLPEEYDLHFTIPRVNSKKEDEYTGRPLDFCFLFDGQNIDGMQLQSIHAYYEHAANCIYSMAIAPTSSRSNSSEDNVLRDIVREGGRNRYAGAGTSLLEYPTKDVKRYLGLCWTRESVSREWTEIDQRFKEEQELNNDRRKAGFTEQEIDRGVHFINVMKEGVGQYKPFPKAIHDMCMQFKDGEKTIVEMELWNGYYKELDAYLNSSIMQAKNKVRKMEDSFSTHRENIQKNQSNLSDEFQNWYNELVAYRECSVKYVEELSRNLVYSLFRDTKDYTKTDNRFRLEYWLQKGHDPEKFFHPSAIRYMLYNVIALLKKQVARTERAATLDRNKMNDFERVAFDDPSTKDHVETKDEFMEQAGFDTAGFEHFKKRKDIAANKDHLIGAFDEQQKNISKYWTDGVFSKVFASALAYMQQMANVFESFYDSLQNNCVAIDEEIEQMERAYAIVDGVPLRYVCADKDCLKQLAEQAFSPNDALDLPGHLCAKIYSELRAFAMDKIRKESRMQGEENEDPRKTNVANDKFCSYLFNETIVKHQEKKMEEQYGGLIHMDVLKALETEAKIKLPESENKDPDKIRKYMTDVLEYTKKLSEPFIENPRDKEPRGFTVCTYSKKLKEPDTPIPGRKEFVEKYLAGNGVESDDIDPDMILFYKAVYDLRARDLGKFAPPEKTETTDRQAGDYYKAYHELISELHPLPQKSRAITPHLNRWWHVVTQLPELSEESQQMQEESIARAFLWGMLGKFIRFRKDQTDRQFYYPAKNRLALSRSEDGDLITSNGTACDRLYEVLDAFTIYPHLVCLVNKKADELIERDLVNKVPLKNSYLYQMLVDFCVDELPLVKEEKPAKTVARTAARADKPAEEKPETTVCTNAPRSIFELPLLMKRSVPSELYNERIIDQLIDVIFSELYRYHERYCIEKDLIVEYSALLSDQARLLIRNISQDAKNNPQLKLLEDELLDDLLERIEDEIQERGIPSQSEFIRNARKKRTRYGNLAEDAFEE